MEHPARNPVCWFEIPVRDMERAERFYGALLGVTFERAEIDGNAMSFFPGAEGLAGAGGALARGQSYRPGHAGARVYFRVGSVEAALARATAAGGRVLYPRTSIGDLGWVAEIEDSEGNCVALHEVAGPGAA